MLFINGAAINEIITPEQIIAAVEDAFRAFRDGAYELPDRFSCVRDDLTALFMPCFAGQSFGVKMLNLVPGNRMRGLPSIDGLMMLCDAETGAISALMDAKELTAWRTGATGAMAVKYLAKDDAASLGIVGCGVQGLHQAMCMLDVRPIEDVWLFDLFGVRDWFAKQLEEYVKKYEEDPGRGKVRIHICADSRELCENSDIIVTTTFSEEPVLPDDEALFAGKCIVAVGSYKPKMRELPDALFRIADQVFVDLPHAWDESGDLTQTMEAGLLKKENIRMIDSVLDKAADDPVKGKTVIFKTVGMAVVDLFAAKQVFRLAEEAGKGVSVDF